MKHITKKTKENQAVRFIDYIYDLEFLSLKQREEIARMYIQDVNLILSNYGLVTRKEQA